jgi:hypothetical protein
MLEAGVDEQTATTEEIRSDIESNHKVFGPVRYCVVPLWARVGREERVVAALVLGFKTASRACPSLRSYTPLRSTSSDVGPDACHLTLRSAPCVA